MGVMIWWEGGEDAQETEDELLATRRLTFFMSSAQDSFFDVMSATACPRKYDRHPNDSRLVLVRIAPEQREDSFRIWDIDLEYTSKPKDKDKEQNPLSQPAEIEWDTVEESEVIDVDGEGNPLLNAAGDFLEGIEEPVSYWIIKIKKNVAKVPRYILDYDLSVNDGAVRVGGLTFPKDTLWLRRLRISDKQTENDIDYYEFSFELHYKSKTWIRKFPNRGYHEIIYYPEGTIVKQRILIDLEPAAEPQWLDENGSRPTEIVTVGGTDIESVKKILDPEDIHFVEYRTKKRKNFSRLPLK